MTIKPSNTMEKSGDVRNDNHASKSVRRRERRKASKAAEKRESDDSSKSKHKSSGGAGRAVEARTYRTRAVSGAALLQARYRDWFHACARTVQDKTSRRVGYVHLPDMEETGNESASYTADSKACRSSTATIRVNRVARA